jgi:hypothetical protein
VSKRFNFIQEVNIITWFQLSDIKAMLHRVCMFLTTDYKKGSRREEKLYGNKKNIECTF